MVAQPGDAVNNGTMASRHRHRRGHLLPSREVLQ